MPVEWVLLFLGLVLLAEGTIPPLSKRHSAGARWTAQAGMLSCLGAALVIMSAAELRHWSGAGDDVTSGLFFVTSGSSIVCGVKALRNSARAR